MDLRSELAKRISTVLITGLLALSVQAAPVSAPTADLGGTLLSRDEIPLVGARVFAANSNSGEVFPSDPTGKDGRFALKGLPPATYELGVQVGDGLFVVGNPLAVAAGSDQNVNIAVGPGNANAEPAPSYAATGQSVWNNPFTAALIVLGSAVVVGVLVDNAVDDEGEASGF